MARGVRAEEEGEGRVLGRFEFDDGHHSSLPRVCQVL